MLQLLKAAVKRQQQPHNYTEMKPRNNQSFAHFEQTENSKITHLTQERCEHTAIMLKCVS